MPQTGVRSEALRFLTRHKAAIENAELADYGLAEAIEDLQRDQRYFRPTSHSTCPAATLRGFCEFEARTLAIETLARALEWHRHETEAKPVSVVV